MLAGEPKSVNAPETSRNASSMDSGSTSGVNSSNSDITRRECSRYFAIWPGSTTAVGHSLSASAIGIAERTP